MKKWSNVVLILILILVPALSGCGGGTSSPGGGNPGGGTTYTTGDAKTYTAGTVSFTMRYVLGGVTFPTESVINTLDDKGTATVATAYWIADTEVTYELWEAVYNWAMSHEYTFSAGSGSGQYPVTTISWRDAIVWCNALTEYYAAKGGTSYQCVYYHDSAYATPIRSTGDSSIDQPYIYAANDYNIDMANCTANGFRLPVGREWELAARYIKDSDSDGDICDSGEYYPGDHVSGDTTGSCYEGNIDPTPSNVFGNYAWYRDNSGSSTHIVGTAGKPTSTTPKTGNANALGLYDMSGNVSEWCFDSIISGRVYRGGSFDDSNTSSSNLALGLIQVAGSDSTGTILGFRPVRTN